MVAGFEITSLVTAIDRMVYCGGFDLWYISRKVIDIIKENCKNRGKTNEWKEIVWLFRQAAQQAVIP